MLLVSLILMASGEVGYGYTSNAICHMDEYYCAFDSSCQSRRYRCTLLEYCHYVTTDMCFKNYSLPGAYGLVLGHMKKLVKTRLFDTHGLTKKVIVFRGLLYEYNRKRKKVIVQDINDPNFKYRNHNSEEWLLDDRGFILVGSSFCHWKDAEHFVVEWNRLYHLRFRLNCLQFTTAFQKFLTTGICAVHVPKRVKEFNEAIDEHTQMVIRRYTKTCWKW